MLASVVGELAPRRSQGVFAVGSTLPFVGVVASQGAVERVAAGVPDAKGLQRRSRGLR